MDTDQRVDASDREDASHSGVVPYDQIQTAAALVALSRGSGEEPDAGRVQERARAEIDDDVLAPGLSRESRSEDVHGREIEFARDMNDDSPRGRLLDPYVKIAWRGHESRV